MKVRFFIESMIFLGLAVFFQIYVNDFNNYVIELNKLIEEFNNSILVGDELEALR